MHSRPDPHDESRDSALRRAYDGMAQLRDTDNPLTFRAGSAWDRTLRAIRALPEYRG